RPGSTGGPGAGQAAEEIVTVADGAGGAPGGKILFSAQRPGLAVLLAEVALGLRLAGLEAPRLPADRLADAVGDVAQQHRLGQQAGVAEVARRRPAVLARLHPLLVVAHRRRDRLGRPLVTGEVLLGQQLVAVVVGQQQALAADEQVAVAPT